MRRAAAAFERSPWVDLRRFEDGAHGVAAGERRRECEDAPEKEVVRRREDGARRREKVRSRVIESDGAPVGRLSPLV